LTFRGPSGLNTGMSTHGMPTRGDIRRSQPPHQSSGAEPRLVLVTGLDHTLRGRPVITARLLTNEIELATGAEDYLPPDHTPTTTGRPVRPYALLVHEFPLYLDPRHLSPTLSITTTPLALTHPDVPLGCQPLTPPRPGDVRWRWKLAELHATRPHGLPLCCLLDECNPPCP
jgi:hypothetical protein